MRFRVTLAVTAGLAATTAPGLSAEPAAALAPVEVMVLGTYHFDNPGLDLNNAKADDVLKPARQAELAAIAAALVEYRPTKVMVERVADDLVDANYAAFAPAALGVQRDERVQLGYRIAHRLGLETVQAIDEQPSAGEPDYFPFGKLVVWAKANDAHARVDAMMAKGAAVTGEIERLQATGTIADVLIARNDALTVEREQGIYYEMLALGDAAQQPGADLNAMWYLRNAKIFAKLQLVAKPGDRVLVIYGSGHNYWLRHFAAITPGYRSVDPVPYLKRAAKTRP